MRSHLKVLAFVLTCTPAVASADKIAVMPTLIEESASGRVPDLFDDYLLAAVQNSGDFEVIGSDDINTILGFEQQKDVFGCDDSSCIAELGGALGVDKIVSVKVARLDTDWVCTAKLINIKTARVENRVNQMVEGGTKELLKSLPALSARLFGKKPTPVPSVAPSPEPTPEPTPDLTPTVTVPPTAGTALVAPTPQTAPPPNTPNASYGRAARIIGNIMLYGGGGLALLGGAVASGGECYYDSYTDEEDCGEVYEASFFGGMGIIAGLVVTGIGAKQYANGRARANLGDPEASGRPSLYWLGWTLSAGAMLAPFLGATETISDGAADILGWGGGLGGLAVFIIGSHSPTVRPRRSAEATFGDTVTPMFSYARNPDSTMTPVFGFGGAL